MALTLIIRMLVILQEKMISSFFRQCEQFLKAFYKYVKMIPKMTYLDLFPRVLVKRIGHDKDGLLSDYYN